MATVDYAGVPADSHCVPFDYLHLGRSNQEVVCRLLRFSDARNLKREREFLGIVLLLLDEKDTLIHAFIPASPAAHYRRSFQETAIIKIAGFEVSRCTKMYKVTDHPFVIPFLPHTTLEQVGEITPKIEAEKFMLRKHEHLQALANTNLELSGRISIAALNQTFESPPSFLRCQIRIVQGSNLGDATSTHRVIVRLLIEPSVTVSVSLWDDAAANFRAHLGSDAAMLSTMLVTTVNPKIFGGGLFLNSTPTTRSSLIL